MVPAVNQVELHPRLQQSELRRFHSEHGIVTVRDLAAALNEGSVLLVQALVTLSLMFALPINARFSCRKVCRAEWMWAALLTAGVIVVVVVGNPLAGRTSAPLQTWAMVAAVFGPILIGCLIIGRARGGAVTATSYAFVAGSLWGVFAVLVKEVDAHLGDAGRSVTLMPKPPRRWYAHH